MKQYLINWKVKLIALALLCLISSLAKAIDYKKKVLFCGDSTNDLYRLLNKEGFDIRQYDSPHLAISEASMGAVVIIVADNYPTTKNKVSQEMLTLSQKKSLRLYVEYPSSLPGLTITPQPVTTKFERGIITSSVFGEGLKPMSLLGINDCYVLPVEVNDPLIVLGKVAGFDKAEYGIDDIKTYPLLFQKNNMMVAMTKLSNFATGRYAPERSWQLTWQYIMAWLTENDNFRFAQWPSYVSPMYTEDATLPKNARRESIAKGVEWFSKGHFYIHPSWKETWLNYQGDGTAPLGPPVGRDRPNGDGSLGILEGHASHIYYDGTQQYRYWIRADVQGEVAYALAAAGNYLHKKSNYQIAENLVDFIFNGSNLRSGDKNDKSNQVYGLIGWSVTHPGVFYGDDNARCVLGIIGASAFMNTDKWNKEIVEAIMANFRTTGKEGFRGPRLNQKDIQELGWKHYWERDIVNPHPHFEAWMWACYLWLYDKTGYEPLLTKTRNAIRMTMEVYPDQWKWTNGIQQERARMILPLAWLVRVDNTAEHREWLDKVVAKLLANQQPNGAIREELGAGKGQYGRTASNKEYGLHEAPLIFENGDPVADMLYTSNFAFFSLNEAAHVTGNKTYKAAVEKLSDFLTRIQVKSDQYKDVDGAWFRAFDFGRWDYWASNADAGWGAWATLTGWTQSWIVATQVLVDQDKSYWDVTKNTSLTNQMPETITAMFGTK